MIVSDFLYRFGYFNYPERVYFIAGMALGGTTLVKNLMARIPGIYTRKMPMPSHIKYNQDFCDSGFKYMPKYGNALYKTHLNPSKENVACIKRNGVRKILVVYRDFRDVAVSRYYRLVEFPKPKEAFDFVDYKALGREKALTHSVEIVSGEFVDWLRGWKAAAKSDPDNYLFVRFKELKSDTFEMFKKILDFYGLKFTDDEVKGMIGKAKARPDAKLNMMAAEILPDGYATNLRSGKIGTWKNEMSDTQKQRAKELLGEALIEFGFEKDLNW